MVKNLPASAGDVRDVSSVSESGRSSGGGCGNPFQYFCLENPMDRGAWQAIVQKVTKSWTWLKQLTQHSTVEIFYQTAHSQIAIRHTRLMTPKMWLVAGATEELSFKFFEFKFKCKLPLWVMAMILSSADTDHQFPDSWLNTFLASLVPQMVKNLQCSDPGLISGWEDPLEKEMATYSSVLAWRIPWTEEPGALWSRGSQRVRRDWND